ncbi:hypothetical protein ABT158_16115 [Nonomuraea sp. NPDC001636]|uniref:hypothetical protein n=1 Tax=Nonomuraea sp. NPDC001636 TaxID=3154391 RepID=UPI003325638F
MHHAGAALAQPADQPVGAEAVTARAAVGAAVGAETVTARAVGRRARLLVPPFAAVCRRRIMVAARPPRGRRV